MTMLEKRSAYEAPDRGEMERRMTLTTRVLAPVLAFGGAAGIGTAAFAHTGSWGHVHVGDVPVLADPVAIAAAAAALGAAAVLAAGRRLKPKARPVRVDEGDGPADPRRGDDRR